MSAPLKLLCVHGVGNQEADATVRPAWESAIGAGLRMVNPDTPIEFYFLEYDALFEAAPRDLAVWSEALRRLLSSGLRAGAEKLPGLFRGGPPPAEARGLGDWYEAGRETLQWTAGMVAQWAADPKLRALARRRLLEAVTAARPDAVIAHSLGSLIAYDAFARPQNAAIVADTLFISLGSQINNPFVRDLFGGRLVPLPSRHWYHLYNAHDDAFTAPIPTALDRFMQVDTTFDLPGLLDHDAAAYLGHPRTRQTVWAALAGRQAPAALAATRGLTRRASPAAGRPRNLQEALGFAISSARIKPARRALLVGINEYPDARMELQGCVNDVYLMSELLQEHDFAPEDIRIVLNDRATADGLRERLAWLLEDCQNGFDRVLYYSGHGAQISSYGIGETVDAVDECLVPWDFDWTLERAITDDWFHECYSQLPPQSRFLGIFDCCHSGGIARDGGARVRGIDPPDDLRHRLLRWDDASGVWKPRGVDLEQAPPVRGRKAAAKAAGPPTGVRFRRLGRGMRDMDAAASAFKTDPEEFGLTPGQGTYMPILLQACQEGQKAFEYRHGSTPQGAFTFSLVRALRQRSGRKYTWAQLLEEVGGQIRRLGYRDQAPGHEGPPGFEADPIPWAQKQPAGR